MLCVSLISITWNALCRLIAITSFQLLVIDKLQLGTNFLGISETFIWQPTIARTDSLYICIWQPTFVYLYLTDNTRTNKLLFVYLSLELLQRLHRDTETLTEWQSKEAIPLAYDDKLTSYMPGLKHNWVAIKTVQPPCVTSLRRL